MRTFLWRTLATAAFVGCATLAYTQTEEPARIETIKLAENLYVIYNDFVPGNSTFLVTNEGVILVDDKYPQDGANILAEIKKVTPQPVKYIINTHHHGDHSGSNELIQKAFGAQIVSSVNARRNMVTGKQPGQSNITFDEKAHIDLGGEHVDLYYFGKAHTDGDIVAVFPKYRLMSSGDLFAYGDATPELIDYDGGGSAIEWTKTLNKALQLDFDRVVPGHGVVTTKAEMTRFRDTSIQLTNRVRTMVRGKKSRADVEKMLRSEFHYADVHVMFSLDGLMKEMR